MSANHPSDEVTAFLDGLSHPRRDDIEALRQIILSSKYELTESIKWNGPNYSDGAQDRITIRINPPNKLQVIFHRGAKVKVQPTERLLMGDYQFLNWKENDRAIATFKTVDDIEKYSEEFRDVVDGWIKVTRQDEH